MPRGRYRGYVKLDSGKELSEIKLSSVSSSAIAAMVETTQKHEPAHCGHVKVDEHLGCDIYYEVHYIPHRPEPSSINNFCNVLLLHGLACNTKAWWPQIDGFMTAQSPPPATFLRVCTMDNRGIGKSSAPKNKKDYSTEIMARDALKVMKALNWNSCHVVGFSMGGMIATKLASMSPQAVRSLTLIGVTGGGWQCLPKTWKGIKYVVKGMLHARTPEARANVDLSFHFASHTLKAYVPHHARTRRQLLAEEYVHNGLEAGGTQEPCGLDGQLHACWMHKVSKKDIKNIIEANFPVMYIHGRHDLLAGAKYAQRLAEKMHGTFIVLNGAHFITRECGHQVNTLLATFVVGHQPGVDMASFLEPRFSKAEEKISQVTLTESNGQLSASFQVESSSEVIAPVLS